MTQVFAHSPEAKGQVERASGTVIRDRADHYDKARNSYLEAWYYKRKP